MANPMHAATLATTEAASAGAAAPDAAAQPGAPAFRTAEYTFTLVSLDIFNTRSVHKDSDKASLSLAVGTGTPLTVTKDLGDLDNGHFPVGLSIGPVSVSDPNVGVAFNYLVVNSGHTDDSTLDSVLTKVGTSLATKGATAASAAAGAAIGGELGTDVLPVIGTILGVVAGYFVGDLVAIIDANCDGPVAAEQPTFKGIDLWNWTHMALGALPVQTYHPGVDSNAGCGANSQYVVTWKVARTDRPQDQKVAGELKLKATG